MGLRENYELTPSRSVRSPVLYSAMCIQVNIETLNLARSENPLKKLCAAWHAHDQL